MSDENNGGGAAEIDVNDPRVKAIVEAEAAKREEGLRKNRDELKAEKLKLQEELKRFQGVDLDELLKLKAEIDERESKKAEEQGDWKKVLEERDKRHRSELEKIQNEYGDKLTKVTSAYQNLLVESELTSALAKANVAAPLLNAAKAVLKAGIEIVEDPESEGYKAVARVGGDELSIADRVRLWAESEEGQYFVAAPLNSGGGGNGRSTGKGGGVNPWKPETWNLSDQGKLILEDPQKAKELARQAGKTINI